jgi:hypothetical protein
MRIPPLLQAQDANHRCGGLRVWLGFDTNHTGQLVDSLSGPTSASAVLVNRFKDADLCLPECDSGQTDAGISSSDSEGDSLFAVGLAHLCGLGSIF